MVTKVVRPARISVVNLDPTRSRRAPEPSRRKYLPTLDLATFRFNRSKYERLICFGALDYDSLVSLSVGRRCVGAARGRFGRKRELGALLSRFVATKLGRRSAHKKMKRKKGKGNGLCLGLNIVDDQPTHGFGFLVLEITLGNVACKQQWSVCFSFLLFCSCLLSTKDPRRNNCLAREVFNTSHR